MTRAAITIPLKRVTRPYESGTEVHSMGPRWSVPTSEGQIEVTIDLAAVANDSPAGRPNQPGEHVESTAGQITVAMPRLGDGGRGAMRLPASEVVALGRALLAAAGLVEMVTTTPSLVRVTGVGE